MDLLDAVKRDSLVARNQAGDPILFHDGCEPEVMRERIKRLGEFMLMLPDRFLPHVEHEVTDGMYLRKLFIPKGTLLVGKVHRKHCHNIVAAGDITVLTETGCRRIGAGFTGMSTPGTQKVGLAHEDTVFINVFHTDKTSLEQIEAEIASAPDGGQGLEYL